MGVRVGETGICYDTHADLASAIGGLGLAPAESVSVCPSDTVCWILRVSVAAGVFGFRLRLSRIHSVWSSMKIGRCFVVRWRYKGAPESGSEWGGACGVLGRAAGRFPRIPRKHMEKAATRSRLRPGRGRDLVAAATGSRSTLR